MPEKSKAVRLNRNTGFIKVIAMITMLIDHLGARVFPDIEMMRIIGRIAFPIYAYCIAVGCVCTKSMPRYVLRMAVMAVLVQPLYITAMGHQTMLTFDWLRNFCRVDLILSHYYLPHPSILFTLLAGQLLIWTLREKKYLLALPVTAVIYYISGSLDYGFKGVLLMVLFYVLIDRPSESFAWVLAYMVWWGVPSIKTSLPSTEAGWHKLWISTQFWAILSLPFIYAPMTGQLRLPKWVFYGFYPAHLVLIYLLTL